MALRFEIAAIPIYNLGASKVEARNFLGCSGVLSGFAKGCLGSTGSFAGFSSGKPLFRKA